MQRVTLFLAIIAVAVAGALTLIRERTAMTRTGYRVAELRSERQRLYQQTLELEAKAASLKSAGRIMHKVDELKLPLAPPDRQPMPEQEEPPEWR